MATGTNPEAVRRMWDALRGLHQWLAIDFPRIAQTASSIGPAEVEPVTSFPVLFRTLWFDLPFDVAKKIQRAFDEVLLPGIGRIRHQLELSVARNQGKLDYDVEEWERETSAVWNQAIDEFSAALEPIRTELSELAAKAPQGTFSLPALQYVGGSIISVGHIEHSSGIAVGEHAHATATQEAYTTEHPPDEHG